ncbi:coil containing protein [Vibrio phage 2.275.O._10N.286.54.E11]|nr:coil containing protein [Vibrio phage 2.275.O._10N.286.54.E11]
MDDRETLLALLETDIADDVRNRIIEHLLKDTGIGLPRRSWSNIKLTKINPFTGAGNKPVTGREYLENDGSFRALITAVKEYQDRADKSEFLAKQHREECGKIEALYDEVKEVLDVHKLVETDYEEIIADLYLRSGDEE